MTNQLKGERGEGTEEPDSPIVVRDGRADHLAKGEAEGQREQSTHRGGRLFPIPVPSTLLVIGVGVWFIKLDAKPGAHLSEEPGAGKPHAGICEGGFGQPVSLP